MNKFENLTELHTGFRNRTIGVLLPTIFLGGVEFRCSNANRFCFESHTHGGMKAMAVYNTATVQPINRLVFMWLTDGAGCLVPTAVKGINSDLLPLYETIIEGDSQNEKDTKKKLADIQVKGAEVDLLAKARIAVARAKKAEIDTKVAGIKAKAEEEEINKKKAAEEEEEGALGMIVPTVIYGINSNQPLDAKLDTGADISSLHATDVKIGSGNGTNTVTFACNGKRYRMDLKDTQAVQSADGGTEQRPVVAFTIGVKNKQYPDMMFNLNDRSGMQQPVLLGMNVLNKMGAKLDLTKEHVTEFGWACLDVLFEDEQAPLLDLFDSKVDDIASKIVTALKLNTNI